MKTLSMLMALAGWAVVAFAPAPVSSADVETGDWKWAGFTIASSARPVIRTWRELLFRPMK